MQRVLHSMNNDLKKKSLIFRKAEIHAALEANPLQGKHMLEPLKSIAEAHNLPFNIIELSAHTNNVEVHAYISDIWFCLEGEVKFLCGGIMQKPHTRVRFDGTLDETEVRATGLEDAEEIIMKPGDWLWIPAGEPHQHVTENTARLIIIKVPKSNEKLK